MAEINFKNQYPIFAEKQKKLWPRIKEIFTRKPKDKFGFQPSPQNFGEKLKSFAETTKERFVDNWFRNAPLSPLSSSNLQPGSLFKKYTPKPTVTPEPKGVVLADKTEAIKPTIQPTITPWPTFAPQPTITAERGVGPPVVDPITFKGLDQRLPDATIAPIIRKTSDTYSMNASLIAAFLLQESKYVIDARLDGGEDGIDRGIAQINTKWHPEVTDKQADDPNFAIDWLAKEFQASLKRYDGDINRAIAAHNRGPTGAWEEGNTPSGLDKLGQRYVDNVARNLTPELRKELGILTTYDSL